MATRAGRCQLPAHIAAFTIAGSLGKRVVVTRRAATGSCRSRARSASRPVTRRFAPANAFIAYETGHLELLASACLQRRCVAGWSSCAQLR